MVLGETRRDALLDLIKVVAAFDPDWSEAAALEALRGAHVWLVRSDGRDLRYDRLRRRARDLGRADCLHPLPARPGRDKADMLFADLLEVLDGRFGGNQPTVAELEVVGLAPAAALTGLLCLYAFDEVWPTPEGFIALRTPAASAGGGAP